MAPIFSEICHRAISRASCSLLVVEISLSRAIGENSNFSHWNKQSQQSASSLRPAASNELQCSSRNRTAAHATLHHLGARLRERHTAAPMDSWRAGCGQT